MRQTELNLSEEDRSVIEAIRSKGMHQAREVNRAHVLSSLDRGIPEAQIMAVLGIGRTAVWRARSAYLQGAWNWRCSMLRARGDRASTTPTTRHTLQPWRALRHPRTPALDNGRTRTCRPPGAWHGHRKPGDRAAHAQKTISSPGAG